MQNFLKMENKSLKQSTVNGVIWSAIEKFSTLAIQMICTLIIAQFLTPSDFGTVGMLTIFIAIAQCLVDSGFRTALIRKSDASNLDYSSVFYFNIVFSAVLYSALYFGSPFIASFYNIPELEGVAKIAFVVIPINAFGLIQGTILTKNLQFKTITRVTLYSAIISGAVGVYLAFQYKSLWALVVQHVLFYCLQTCFLWLFTKWRPLIAFSVASIRGMLSFSLNMMLSSLIGTIFSNLYGLIIGKLYTPADLGNYSQAQKLQSLPSTSITEVIQRVTYPVLSRFQHDDTLLKNAYRRMIGVSFLIVAYVMFLLMAISTPLFDVLFSDEWAMAGKFFAILCLNGVFYPLHSININILTVKGKSKEYLFLEIARRCMFVLVVAITANFTIDVFVWGMVVYSVIVLTLNLAVCGYYIQYSIFDQIKDLTSTFLIGATAMIVAKYGVSLLISNSWLLGVAQLIVALLIMLSLSVVTRNKYFFEIVEIAQSKFKRN